MIARSEVGPVPVPRNSGRRWARLFALRSSACSEGAGGHRPDKHTRDRWQGVAESRDRRPRRPKTRFRQMS